MTLRYLLFDAVGTLIRVEPSVAEIYAAVAYHFGSRLTIAEIRGRFPAAFSKHQDDGPTDERRERRRWRGIVRDVISDVVDPAAAESLFEELWQRFASVDSWRVYDDVPPVWKELEERGYQLGIASNFDQRLVGLSRALFPLNRARHLFISAQLGAAKPQLEFFRRIERALQCPPEEILLIGDDWENDIAGGQHAGWQTIFIDRAEINRMESDSLKNDGLKRDGLEKQTGPERVLTLLELLDRLPARGGAR